jgi:muramoyltetrapeptide carboxypeptidase LdcA involved in peptidoglycan recycling
LETIHLHLLDTDLLDFDGAIAFLETSELRPSPDEVGGYLSALISRGALRGVRGLVLGRPYGYTDEDKKRLWAAVMATAGELDIPILADVDCGHTDPMLTLPFGVSATLDCDGGTFSMNEVATKAP